MLTYTYTSKGKFELIESLPSDGIGVLNGDDEKQVNYNLKNDCKIVWIGIENKNVKAKKKKTSKKSASVEDDTVIETASVSEEGTSTIAEMFDKLD